MDRKSGGLGLVRVQCAYRTLDSCEHLQACALSLSLNSQDVPSWQQRCVLCGTCLPSCEHDGFQMRGSCRFVGDAMWGQGDGTQPNAEKKNAHGQKGELPFGWVDVDGRRASLAFHLPRVSMIRSPVQSHKLLRN